MFQDNTVKRQGNFKEVQPTWLVYLIQKHEAYVLWKEYNSDENYLSNYFKM